MIKRELELAVDRSFFGTDSTSVLKYVADSHSRFHTFVANRLSFWRLEGRSVRTSHACDFKDTWK